MVSVPLFLNNKKIRKEISSEIFFHELFVIILLYHTTVQKKTFWKIEAWTTWKMETQPKHNQDHDL